MGLQTSGLLPNVGIGLIIGVEFFFFLPLIRVICLVPFPPQIQRLLLFDFMLWDEVHGLGDMHMPGIAPVRDRPVDRAHAIPLSGNRWSRSVATMPNAIHGTAIGLPPGPPKPPQLIGSPMAVPWVKPPLDSQSSSLPGRSRKRAGHPTSG